MHRIEEHCRVSGFQGRFSGNFTMMDKSLLGPKQKSYIDQGRGKISVMLPYGTEVNVLCQSGVLAIKYTIGNFEKTIKITLDKNNVIKAE